MACLGTDELFPGLSLPVCLIFLFSMLVFEVCGLNEAIKKDLHSYHKYSSFYHHTYILVKIRRCMRFGGEIHVSWFGRHCRLGDRWSMVIKKHYLSYFYESSYHFLHKNTKFNCTNPFYQFLRLMDVEVSCHTNLKTLTNGQQMLLWGLNVKIFI